jgi:hypothetical protein
MFSFFIFLLLVVVEQLSELFGLDLGLYPAIEGGQLE